ncbi:hypothetical protein AX16_004994 [Volvariella volvacea WC 439]|nr:hypothetical protein AX16_004994 [Volvariella volvacea WC 439]
MAATYKIDTLTLSMSSAGDALDLYAMPFASGHITSGGDINMFEEEISFASLPSHDALPASRHPDSVSQALPTGDAQALDVYAVDDDDSELTKDGDRDSRPSVVPQPNTHLFSFSQVAILSPTAAQSSSSRSQDVRQPLNSSAASSSLHRFSASRNGSSRNPETTVSTPSSNNDLNNIIYSQNRPVFESTQALAQHYGIPQVLPPAPRPHTDRTNQAFADFATLSQNYLAMLSKSSSDNTSMSTDSTVSPADLMVPAQSAAGQDELFNLLGNAISITTSMTRSDAASAATPDMFTPLMGDFDSPLDDSPLAEFLQTPIMDDVDNDIFAADDDSLFEPTWSAPIETSVSPKQPPPSSLYTMSPISPAMDAVNPTSLFPSKSAKSTDTSIETPSSLGKRRRSTANGTRKGLTVEALVPLDAPTQTRRYVTPSATSKKDLPAMIQRKRARLQTPVDEGDAPPPPSASEQELIDYKRRQNTLAARKSRMRKLEHQQKLEAEVEQLKQERDTWKVRTEMLMHTLRTHNIPAPDLSNIPL